MREPPKKSESSDLSLMLNIREWWDELRVDYLSYQNTHDNMIKAQPMNYLGVGSTLAYYVQRAWFHNETHIVRLARTPWRLACKYIYMRPFFLCRCVQINLNCNLCVFISPTKPARPERTMIYDRTLLRLRYTSALVKTSQPEIRRHIKLMRRESLTGICAPRKREG